MSQDHLSPMTNTTSAITEKHILALTLGTKNSREALWSRTCWYVLASRRQEKELVSHIPESGNPKVHRINQVAEVLNLSPASPFQHQRENPGEDLESCGKAKAKRSELMNLPLKGYVKLWLRIQVDTNPEIGSLPDAPLRRGSVSILNMARVT